MLLGSIVLAIVFGHVAVLVANFNANSTNYQRKMEAVFAITSKMQLPEPLRERVHQYYDHLWREYEPLDGEIERFSKNLSHTLELEVVLCKYMDLIMGIPFWVDCSPDFQKQLMLNLRVRVYMPGDYVIRRGEVDEEFYMISRGSVELATGRDSFERPIGTTRDVEENDLTSALSDRSLPNHSNQRGATNTMGSGDVHRRDSARSIYQVDNFIDDDPWGQKKPSKSPHTTDDSFLKILTKSQAFGEMALVMNYQRTADVRAITYIEVCVLNRSDFQRILTTHPEDRKKVVSVMLSGYMISNKTRGVKCPLADTVRSVYSINDPVRRTPMGAEEAASLILDAANSDVDDSSIKFGVNARLRQQLMENRVANTRVVDEVLEALTPQNFSNPDTLREVRTSRSEQPPTLVFASDGEDNPQPPPVSEARIERIEHVLESLLEMMSEMRSAIDRISLPTAPALPSTHSRWIPARSAHQHSRMLKTRSTTSLTVQRVADKLQQYGRPTEGQLSNAARQLPSRVFWVTDGASRSDDAASARSQLPIDLHKRILLQKTRQTSFAARSSVAPKLAAPSPTQFADQLFGARPCTVFFRHSPESGDSPYSLASLSVKK